MKHSKPKHHYHSPAHRAFYSLLLISIVMLVGIVGIHTYEHVSYIDAFYIMSMIATAQGLAMTPMSAAGKIFISVMAFISVGSVVAALGFLFGPFLGKLWKVGSEKLEEEIEILESKAEKLKKK